MKKLEALEQEFGFKYPELYKELYKNKMLDSGEYSYDWLQLTYPKLKENPPLLLYGQDFELTPIDEIQSIIEEMRDPDDYREINPDYLFVPFGQTGGGDYYCFWYHFPEEIEADQPLIVLLPHDDIELEILAKNLEDFIFSELCKSVCDVYEEGLIMDGSFKENSTNMLRTHLPYLSEEKQRIVSELYQREWFTHTFKVSYGKGEDSYQGLITREDLEELLEKEIGFEYQNQTYYYDKDTDTPPLELHKIEGMLWLYFSPKPEEDSPVYELLKQLNWRKDKSITDKLAYQRKLSQFTPHTDWATRQKEILSAFLPRLQKLKAFEGFQLVFKDDNSGEIIDLTPYI